MEKRHGGKFGGNHASLIDLAAELADYAVRLPDVNRISPGIVQSGEGAAG